MSKDLIEKVKLLRRDLIEKEVKELFIRLFRRVIPGRGKCLCKNPEVGACLAHSGDRGGQYDGNAAKQR